MRDTLLKMGLHRADGKAISQSIAGIALGAGESTPMSVANAYATLAANGLKVLDDGLILKSQAQLAASLAAKWSAGQRDAAERLLRVVEARAQALSSAALSWPTTGDAAEARVIEALAANGATRRPGGLLVESGQAAAASVALTAAGLGPVTAVKPDFVFEVACASFDALAARI